MKKVPPKSNHMFFPNMRYTTTAFLLSLCTALSTPPISFGFQPIPSLIHLPSSTTPSSSSSSLLHPLQSTTESTTEQTKSSISKYESSKGLVKVIFSAKKKLSSQPISLSQLQESQISLSQFFTSSQNRNLILSKDIDGVQNISSSIPPNSRLLQLWKQQSEGYDIDPSVDMTQDDSYEVLEVVTRTQFPGMVLKSMNIIGSKRIFSNSDQQYDPSQYQLTLLDTKLEPEGNSPIVWLFKKIVGKETNGISKQPMEEPRGSSFTTFTLEYLNDNEIQFTSDAKLSVRVEFPKLLIRLLPVSLEKMEEQGSKSMQSTIDKEVGPALERYVDTLMALMK